MIKQHKTSHSSDPTPIGSDIDEIVKISFFERAYNGDVQTIEFILQTGLPLDTVEPHTGMTALHLAVGCNHLELARFLVERGASFVPDKRGRMPTTIAAECEASEELCDFIVEAEAAFEAKSQGRLNGPGPFVAES